ncbi:MAG: cupin domain-containing protein [Planctomycetota bacterium]|jgi:quercetin dioxygenase-like cupin family protein
MEIENGMFSAADAVEYQSGGIVSRAVLKKEKGSVTLFAFDRGQELSEHSAPYEALIQVLEGRAEITIGGKVHEVGSGGMIVLPANVPHAVRAPEPFKMILTMIRS